MHKALQKAQGNIKALMNTQYRKTLVKKEKNNTILYNYFIVRQHLLNSKYDEDCHSFFQFQQTKSVYISIIPSVNSKIKCITIVRYQHKYEVP